jgi:phospholipid/cholesterol/gamma-HCH transport system substrate-binding protein
METDKRYFFEGLFIIGLTLGIALFAVWIVDSGEQDDVYYRVRFAESVSGLALGDPVKFHGVDVGTVKAMALDPENPRLVVVELRLRKATPVKTDTRASLRLKGITGAVYVELNGGSPAAKTLLAATPSGQIPEIPYEKSSLAAIVDQLPKVISKLSGLEDQAQKVISDVGSVASEVKENPSVLLRGRKEKSEAQTEHKPAGPRAAVAGR